MLREWKTPPSSAVALELSSGQQHEPTTARGTCRREGPQSLGLHCPSRCSCAQSSVVSRCQARQPQERSRRRKTRRGRKGEERRPEEERRKKDGGRRRRGGSKGEERECTATHSLRERWPGQGSPPLVPSSGARPPGPRTVTTDGTWRCRAQCVKTYGGVFAKNKCPLDKFPPTAAHGQRPIGPPSCT